MQGKLSRRKIAQYVAEHVPSGRVPEQVMNEVAAYLVETRRVREAALVVRAIEDALFERGIAVVTVTSARPLDDELRQAVTAQVGMRDVYLRELVDPTVLGGIRLQTADASYDGTLAHKLNGLAAAKL
ncbi:F0F1 ATP synthase subunit delta [Candidatus Saccharibacteria bacterium]|nr:MAG: F0F1 ATP synthase subunit delta [Candidatus Saccharibacteria bacterium]